MDRKMIAVIAVLALSMTTIAIPMDDSDAETQTAYMSEY